MCVVTDERRGCEDGEVRLQAGLGPSNGYVELCLDRTWVGICSDGLDISHARTVCNQLNFDPQGKCLYLSMPTVNLKAGNFSRALDAIITEGPANTGYDPVFQTQVTCEDSEQHFNKCRHARPQTGSCTQLAISCGKSTSKCLLIPSLREVICPIMVM